MSKNALVKLSNFIKREKIRFEVGAKRNLPSTASKYEIQEDYSRRKLVMITCGVISLGVIIDSILKLFTSQRDILINYLTNGPALFLCVLCYFMLRKGYYELPLWLLIGVVTELALNLYIDYGSRTPILIYGVLFCLTLGVLTLSRRAVRLLVIVYTISLILSYLAQDYFGFFHPMVALTAAQQVWITVSLIGAAVPVSTVLLQAVSNDRNGRLKSQNDELQEVVDELKRSNQKLAHTRQMERSANARRIHDGPVQTTELLIRSLHGMKSLTISEKIVLGTLQQLSEELRRIGTEWRPLEVRDGLRLALESMREKLESEIGTQVFLDVDTKNEEFRRYNESIENELYWTAKEAIKNITKHSKATKVDIQLIEEHEMLTLVISDNGVGFDKKSILETKVKEGHVGLLGIHEQIGLLGGKLVIESTPNRGTTLIACVPLFAEDFSLAQYP